MIPRNFITEWRSVYAPWILDAQVEQDLVISRALIELFSSDLITQSLAFRGGTALYKLYTNPPPRYSEDIDLVQIASEPIGPIIDEIRRILDSWLGEPKRKSGRGIFAVTYRFQSEGPLSIPLNLKIEINTREHFSVQGFTSRDFEIRSSWFKGKSRITTYYLEELIGTKLRALFQRKKGRDLFDIWYVFKNSKIITSKVLASFEYYMEKQGLHVTRAQFEQNLFEKTRSLAFTEDIRPLLSPEIEPQWRLEDALAIVYDNILSLMPGKPWKSV